MSVVGSDALSRQLPYRLNLLPVYRKELLALGPSVLVSTVPPSCRLLPKRMGSPLSSTGWSC